MIRRRIVILYWIIAIAFFTPTAVYAYIDPATTTYLIQIITALVVTIGVSLSVFLYRFRMISAKIRYGLYGLLHRRRDQKTGVAKDGGLDRFADAIDSEGTSLEKYIYPDFAMPGAAGPPSVKDMEALGEPPGLEQIAQRDALKELFLNRRYLGRLKVSLPISLGLALSFILIGCLDLAVQNSPDMPFKPGAIVPTLLLASGAVFVLILLVLPLFRGKIFEILISIGFGALISGYIQGNFMNGVLGRLNGDPIEWSQYFPQMVESVLMWALVFVCVFLLLRFAKGVWRGALFVVPILLLIVQGVGLAAALDDYNKNGEASFWVQSSNMLTIEGLHSPAYEKNAIVFVLDRLDDTFVDQIAENHPGFFDRLDGFTRFDDNTTYDASTFPSVTEMLSGVRYMYDQSQNSYFDYAWANASMMEKLKVQGVDIRLYMDRGYAYNSTDQLNGIASNVNKGHLNFSKRVALVKLLKLSAFRYSPMPAKQKFWLSPTDFNDTLRVSDDSAFYLTNDFAFYDNITTNGLRPSDSQLGFFYFHLLGAHGPLNMDENLQFVPEEPAADLTPQRVSQATGCFKIVYNYLDQLKALGLYKDATIIITADHPDYLGDVLKKPMHAALFVKPGGVEGTPLAFSHAPVCPDQLPGTVMEGLFGDREGFAPGYLDMKEGDPTDREFDVNLYRYEIKGDGRDFANWSLIGKFPDTYQ